MLLQHSTAKNNHTTEVVGMGDNSKLIWSFMSTSPGEFRKIFVEDLMDRFHAR